MINPITRPAHYTRSAIEPITAIEAWGLDFHLGNVVKYISRAGHKGDELEDLRKARWYLERAIERREAEVRTNDGLAELRDAEPIVPLPRHWLAEEEVRRG